jgi:hypothetical protein
MENEIKHEKMEQGSEEYRDFKNILNKVLTLVEDEGFSPDDLLSMATTIVVDILIYKKIHPKDYILYFSEVFKDNLKEE